LAAFHACELFGFLSEEDRERLASQCKEITYATGDLLAREGELGHEMFVLVTGVIEIITEAGGEEVILARLDKPGDHVGEQALRDPGAGYRTASIRAATDVDVLVIEQALFSEASQLNPSLIEHVREAGERHARQLSLVERSVMYRALAAFDQDEGWSQDQHFDDGQVIFREGDPGDKVYVIRSGHAQVSRLDGGDEVLLAVLHEGQTFGELAVMGGNVRQATVTASGSLDVVAFDRERFLEITGQVPELHEYLGTLKRVYTLGEGLATQFDGEFRGAPALVTMVKLDDGREAIIHHASDLYSASVEHDESAEVEEISFEDPNRSILRTIGLKAGRLVRIHAEGPWSELDRAHDSLLKSTPVDESTIVLFRQSGHLYDQPEVIDYTDPEATYCSCLKIRRRTLEELLAKGTDTLDGIVAETGASSVCGGCTGRIAEMLGSGGQAVQLIAVQDVGRDVRSFRFEAIDENGADPVTLRTALPGQHVVISARIDEHWMHRPYTISSAANNAQWREITVKREAHGFLSNWLFTNPGSPELRLSHPKGQFWADLDRPEPIVCLVAGIGVTPALAMARTLAERPEPRSLYIDYSARTEPDFSHREELDQLALDHDHITLNYRCTGRGERLGPEAIASIQASHPNASFFICGPPAFQEAVQAQLASLPVRPERIHVEVFTPVGHAPEEPHADRTSGDTIRMWTILGLTGLYLLQALLGLTWSALENAQQSMLYSSITGLALVALIAYQWVLPTLRLRGQLKRAIRHYEWHKKLGLATPVLLYLHSVTLGYAYAFVLAVVWLSNGVVGALDKTLIKDARQREKYEGPWLIAHVVLSCLVLSLALVHIYVAYAYK
jgi:ferredoxin-NADP reductase/CRP-like cAMP-binding protein